MSIYYSFNKNFNYEIFKNTLIIKSKYCEYKFHGEFTTKVLIPLLNFEIFSYDAIIKNFPCTTYELDTIIEKLIERDIIEQYEECDLMNTWNYPNITKKTINRKILIISTVYLSQFTTLEKSFCSFSFEYVFLNISSNLLEKLKDKILNVSSISTMEELKHKLNNSRYDLVVSLCRENFLEYSHFNVNMYLDYLATLRNIPILYANMLNNVCILGPLYIPGKTSSYTDLTKTRISNLDCPSNTYHSYFNPILVNILISSFINEFNWYFYRIGTPNLLNSAIISNEDYLISSYNIYRYK
ncbi:hypothetical protein [Ligilactobacillus agilis]|uniref:hypothetical protein n=1 Tax=Ligilactobacillus agilis TaxID=1601 RepID=UPI0014379D02|nr:hypothetical protein [Ligilactobacillus agilis]GET17033.1 hypothetical protein NB11A_13240 [Ligilactobacillus agilis]